MNKVDAPKSEEENIIEPESQDNLEEESGVEDCDEDDLDKWNLYYNI